MSLGQRLKKVFDKKSQQNTDIDLAYKMLLRREPDVEGKKHYQERFMRGMKQSEFVETLLCSEEFLNNFTFENHIFSLHLSRIQFIKSLPKAARILDLGGTSQNNECGALVALGYPYKFEKLTIVDLPEGDSHEIYKSNKHVTGIHSHLGPIHYSYHSMCDFSKFEDNSFDMVMSGQSIEHITEEQGVAVCEGVMRVLKPGGYFCLDTPNGPACRLLQKSFINDDHKIEYSHEQLSGMLQKAGFKIIEAKGLNYVGESFKKGKMDLKELSRNTGVYHDIAHSYLLAYICQKPISS